MYALKNKNIFIQNLGTDFIEISFVISQRQQHNNTQLLIFLSGNQIFFPSYIHLYLFIIFLLMLKLLFIVLHNVFFILFYFILKQLQKNSCWVFDFETKNLKNKRNTLNSLGRWESERERERESERERFICANCMYI